jgi:hypothetical protein
MVVKPERKRMMAQGYGIIITIMLSTALHPFVKQMKYHHVN